MMKWLTLKIMNELLIFEQIFADLSSVLIRDKFLDQI